MDGRPNSGKSSCVLKFLWLSVNGAYCKYVFNLLKPDLISSQLLCRYDTLLLKRCVTNSNDRWEGD